MVVLFPSCSAGTVPPSSWFWVWGGAQTPRTGAAAALFCTSKGTRALRALVVLPR